MKFNAREIYAEYSIPQLLGILAEREKYDPEVVQAVEEILAAKDTRLVKEAGEAFLVKPSAASAMRAAGASRSNFYKDASGYDEARRRPYWFIIIIATSIVASFYGFPLIMSLIRRGSGILRLRHMQQLAGIVITACTAVGLVLFIRKNRPGWVLMAGTSVYMLSYCITSIGFIFYRQSFSDIWVTLLFIPIYSSVIYLLWLPQIRAIYGVDIRLGQKTVFTALGLIVILLGWTIVRMVDMYRRFG